MNSNEKKITLCLGGVRSGKSRYAQQLGEHSAHVCFIATAQAIDDEMRVKIKHHQADRPAHWQTIEEPVNLPAALRRGSADTVLLVDCLTVYAGNLLVQEESAAACAVRFSELCTTLQEIPSSVVLVSNEVGSGIVPAHAMGRRYRDLLGELNQRVAAIADTVVLMVAGLPLALKGRLEPLS